MRRISMAALLALVAVLSGPSGASAQEAPTASCPGPPQAVVIDENSDARMAQTFVPSVSGGATRAELDVSDVSGQTGAYTIQILATDASGAPSDTVLAQTMAPDVPDGQATLQATFATQPTIVAGHSYALALSRPGGYLGWDVRADSSACPGAFAFQQGGGQWFGAVPGFGPADALFRLFVHPAPTYSTSGTSPVGCKGRQPTITGTDGNDALQGTAGADVIVGLGGKDTLFGLGGNDVICGGPGKDIFYGGGGNDRLYGQAGRDTLRGGSGNDRLQGGAGRDRQIQ